jgi:hypothetical protein
MLSFVKGALDWEREAEAASLVSNHAI